MQMLTLKYNNIWALADGPHEEIAEVSSCLTYTAKGARYSTAYRQGRWNGKKTMFHSKERVFPTRCHRPRIAPLLALLRDDGK